MSKLLVQVVGASVLASSLMSVVVTLAIVRMNSPDHSDIVRAKRIEIVDSERGTRGFFGFSDHNMEATVPRLALLDSNGRESVRLSTDPHGKSELEFASDQWNEGAVILGRIEMSDEHRDGDKGGDGWGLVVRSRANAFTRMGYLDTGQSIAPNPDQTKVP